LRKKKFINIFRPSSDSFHRPKTADAILASKKGEPPVVATRLQRYIYRLSIFDNAVKYRKGKKNGNADCLSRLPTREVEQNIEDKEEEKFFEINSVSEDGKINFNLLLIAVETKKDEHLSKVLKWVHSGWKLDEVHKNFRSYFEKKNLLTVEFGCLVYNSRVVIPKIIQEKVLKMLHVNHCGTVRMIQLARAHVFWMGMDKDIELFINICKKCQETGNDLRNKSYGN
jgi:Integrase zinc binding domain